MKEANLKRLFIFMIPTIWLSGKVKSRDKINISSWRVLEWERNDWVGQRFLEHWNYSGSRTWRHHYIFVKIHRTYNTKTEPYCKLSALGNNAVLYSSITCNKCATLVGDDDNEEDCACGIVWEVSVLSSQFCCEP